MNININGYKQTLLNRWSSIAEELDIARLTLKYAPQMRNARQNGPYPDVYYSFKRKARQARMGAYAMWLICVLLGGVFTVMSYSLPGLSPLMSALLVFLLWATITALIGGATEKIAQFGLNIHGSSPLSAGKAVWGVCIAGLVFVVSFAGLLVLRTVINWPLLIVIQAVFEIAAVCAGGFFHSLYEYFIELPNLRDQIKALRAELDQVETDLAMLEDDYDVAPTLRLTLRLAPSSQSNNCGQRQS